MWRRPSSAGYRTLPPRSSRSRSCWHISIITSRTTRQDIPYRPHKTIDEKLVLLRRRLRARVPDLAIAALHEPSLEVHGVRDVWVVGDGVCTQWQALERGVEVRYAVLGEEADEVEATDGVFALGGGEDGAERRV